VHHSRPHLQRLGPTEGAVPGDGLRVGVAHGARGIGPAAAGVILQFERGGEAVGPGQVNDHVVLLARAGVEHNRNILAGLRLGDHVEVSGLRDGIAHRVDHVLHRQLVLLGGGQFGGESEHDHIGGAGLEGRLGHPDDVAQGGGGYALIGHHIMPGVLHIVGVKDFSGLECKLDHVPAARRGNRGGRLIIHGEGNRRRPAHIGRRVHVGGPVPDLAAVDHPRPHLQSRGCGEAGGPGELLRADIRDRAGGIGPAAARVILKLQGCGEAVGPGQVNDHVVLLARAGIQDNRHVLSGARFGGQFQVHRGGLRIAHGVHNVLDAHLIALGGQEVLAQDEFDHVLGPGRQARFGDGQGARVFRGDDAHVHDFIIRQGRHGAGVQRLVGLEGDGHQVPRAACALGNRGFIVQDDAGGHPARIGVGGRVHDRRPVPDLPLLRKSHAQVKVLRAREAGVPFPGLVHLVRGGVEGVPVGAAVVGILGLGIIGEAVRPAEGALDRVLLARGIHVDEGVGGRERGQRYWDHVRPHNRVAQVVLHAPGAQEQVAFPGQSACQGQLHLVVAQLGDVGHVDERRRRSIGRIADGGRVIAGGQGGGVVEDLAGLEGGGDLRALFIGHGAGQVRGFIVHGQGSGWLHPAHIRVGRGVNGGGSIPDLPLIQTTQADVEGLDAHHAGVHFKRLRGRNPGEQTGGRVHPVAAFQALGLHAGDLAGVPRKPHLDRVALALDHGKSQVLHRVRRAFGHLHREGPPTGHRDVLGDQVLQGIQRVAHRESHRVIARGVGLALYVEGHQGLRVGHRAGGHELIGADAQAAGHRGIQALEVQDGVIEHHVGDLQGVGVILQQEQSAAKVRAGGEALDENPHILGAGVGFLEGQLVRAELHAGCPGAGCKGNQGKQAKAAPRG